MPEPYHNGHRRVLRWDPEHGVDEPDDLDGPIGIWPYQPYGRPYAHPHLTMYMEGSREYEIHRHEFCWVSGDAPFRMAPRSTGRGRPPIWVPVPADSWRSATWDDSDDDLGPSNGSLYAARSDDGILPWGDQTEPQMHDYINNLPTFEFGRLPVLLKTRFPKSVIDLDPFAENQLVIILCGACGVLMTKDEAHELVSASGGPTFDSIDPKCPQCRGEWWKGNEFDLEAVRGLSVTMESAPADDFTRGLEPGHTSTSTPASRASGAQINNQSAPAEDSQTVLEPGCTDPPTPARENSESPGTDQSPPVDRLNPVNADTTNRTGRGTLAGFSETAAANMDWLNYRDKSPAHDAGQPRRDESSPTSQGDSFEGNTIAQGATSGDMLTAASAVRGSEIDDSDEEVRERAVRVEPHVRMRDAVDKLEETVEGVSVWLSRVDWTVVQQNAVALWNESAPVETSNPDITDTGDAISRMATATHALASRAANCAVLVELLHGKSRVGST